MNFKDIDRLLKRYKFFGFTVKRYDNKLRYTYRSVAYYAVVIEVTVMRVNLEAFGFNKMVLLASINGKKIEDTTELVNALNNIYKTQKVEREKLYKKV